MNKLENVVVLLVEDDPIDQELVKNALASQEIGHKLYVKGSAEEALEYLQHSKNKDKQCPRPNLILLDLNMPGMGGKEFLRHIKADDYLCSIPVIILTISDRETDIQQCYKLNAAGYIQKLATPKEFQEIIKKVVKYWFRTSLLAKIKS